MAKLPEPINTTASKIFAHYEATQEDGRRPHLGASLIGGPCERALFYTFRWATNKKHPGRLLRLFQTGHLEEERVAKNLRDIGIELLTESPNGGQWSIKDFGGHFGGSVDGVGLGAPEGPKSWFVWENKSSNTKAFKELQAKGVQVAKPMHYAQATTYMGYLGIERALYTCVCKETDDIYVEWIHFDPVEFAKIKARAERIIRSAEPPLRISNDPSFYQCKFCDHWDVCHGVKAPAVSCRTCAHATPETDGDRRWSCQAFGIDIDLDSQRESHQCTSHRYIPILLSKAGEQVDTAEVDGQLQVLYKSESGEIWSQCHSTMTSNEIARMDDITMVADAARVKRELKQHGIGSEVVR